MVTNRQSPIPDGHYDAKIIASHMRAVNAGSCLDLDFEVIGGEHDSHVIRRQLHLNSPNANTVRKARTELSRICVAVGVMTPKDSCELHDIPMVIQVGMDKQRNTILSYVSKPAASGAAPAPPQAGPELVNLAEIEPEPVQWLWPNRFALGKLTIVAGDPGLGKSFLTMDIAARVSTGAGWPDRPGEPFEPGGVIILSAEDDPADTIIPRLIAAQADRTKIKALKAVRDLDPITAYTGQTDSHKNAETRGLLAPLSDLAAKHDVAMVAVSHLNKGGHGPAIYRTMGSLAFVAAARAVWAITKDENDLARRLMVSVKNNLARDPGGLAYHLYSEGDDTVPALAWDAEPVTITADDALAPPAPGPEPDERAEAIEWLRAALADGPRLGKEVEEEATEGRGFSKGTLRRAREALKVQSARSAEDRRYYWHLPGHESATEEEVAQVSAT